MTLKEVFENIGIGENAGHQHFVLLQLCFLYYEMQILCFG